MNPKHFSENRRNFLKSTAVFSGMSLLPGSIYSMINAHTAKPSSNPFYEKSIIGNYGSWASGLVSDPPPLSFRHSGFQDINDWKKEAMTITREMVSSPALPKPTDVVIDKQYTYDGLEIEEISWDLGYGSKTQAILLKPKGSAGKLPGILALHDHGGNKYFGKRKITKTSDEQHPMMAIHQHQYYGGRAWANELAKKGYVVLVPDSFTFGSRRVLFKDMVEIPWGHCATEGMSDQEPERQENIDKYNRWASDHEHILSKSLFCAGTTWPGVFLAEDRVALDVLSSRNDVDLNQLGCAGLSGGGLRTVYLGGLDSRIKCAVAVGFLTTWKDFLLYKAYTHTWMTYTPILSKYLDFPEILGLRVPLPTMTMNNNQDQLFTLSEMKRADKILQDVYTKADSAEKYRGRFYEGPHKFDAEMQTDAFNWFDQWLRLKK